jgi:hypothetical protein
MTAQETNLSNFFETTLNGTLASSAFNTGTGSQQLTNAPTSNGTDAIAAKFYLVIDPDNTNREVVLVNTISGTEITAMTRDVENRHGLTKPEHTSGTVVRMAVVKEMFEDVHDRVDALPTATSTTTLTNKTISSANNTVTIDADTATVSNIEVDNLKASAVVTESETITSNDNDTTIPTSAAVKNYVDAETATLTNKTLGAVTLSGAVTGGDQEISAVSLKDYTETDVAVTSSSGVVAIDLANGNTGAITLTENITDIDFTNVPANGTSTFTLKITQDSSSSYTVAINQITINGSGHQTAKTPFGGSGYTMTATTSRTDILGFLFFDASTDIYLNALQDFN